LYDVHRPGVNFTNILRAAFGLIVYAPKKYKPEMKIQKDACETKKLHKKMLVKLTSLDSMTNPFGFCLSLFYCGRRQSLFNTIKGKGGHH